MSLADIACPLATVLGHDPSVCLACARDDALDAVDRVAEGLYDYETVRLRLRANEAIIELEAHAAAIHAERVDR